MNAPDQLLSALDVARILAIRRRSVYLYVQRGALPPPDERRSGRPYWHLRTISDWLPTRKGRGQPKETWTAERRAAQSTRMQSLKENHQ